MAPVRSREDRSMQTPFDDETLEKLMVEALRHARRVTTKAREICPGTSLERSTMLRCLDDLERGSVLGSRSEGAISALRAIVDRELETETYGVRRVFDGYTDPEIGDIGSVREVALRTGRGDELADLRSSLQDLMELRQAASDRLRAEQEIRRML
jgi:hypothetical protein